MVIATVLIMALIERKLLVDQSYERVGLVGQNAVTHLGERIAMTEALATALANIGEILPREVDAFKSVLPNIINYEGRQQFIAGGGIWPEPNAFEVGTDRRSFFYGRNKEGGFDYYDDYNDPEGKGYHNEEWYVPAQFYTPGSSFWSKSYMDPYSFQPMVTCTSPMIKEGKFVGASTIDLKLEGLQNFLENEAKSTGGYIFALDRNNKFISFPKPEVVTLKRTNPDGNVEQEYFDIQELSNVASAYKPFSDELQKVNQRLLKEAAGKDGFTEERIQVLAKSYQISDEEARIIAAVTVDPFKDLGDKLELSRFSLENDPILEEASTVSIFHVPAAYWKVVVVTPDSHALAAADKITRKVSGFIIGSQLLALLGAFFAVRRLILGPIKKMSTEVSEMVQRDDDTSLLNDDSDNELGQLAHQFNRRSNQLRSTLTTLEDTRSDLELSEGRTRRIVESSIDSILNVDGKGQISACNPAAAKTFGYTANDMLGRHINSLITLPGSSRPAMSLIEAQRNNGNQTSQRMEAEGARSDGSTFHLDLSLATLNPKEETYAVYVRDVTVAKTYQNELLHAKNQAESAARSKDEFLAGMSHELRTPLNAVLGISESIREGVYGDVSPKQSGALERIEDGGRHLLDLISDILDIAKVGAGELTLQKGPMNISSVCDNSLVFIRTTAMKKQISVNTNATPELGATVADERRVKQILVNLLGNAVKFTNDGGRIDLNVDVSQEEHTVEFAVSDTGIGIGPDDLENLFKPFMQVDSSLAREYSGTGLGLSLVYHMTEMHGGSVRVESEVNKGSTFYVTLPLITLDVKADNTDSDFDEVIARSVPGGQNALVVEDSPDTAAQLCRYLDEIGLSSHHCSRGDEAIEQAISVAPDVIVLDIHLPGLSGWEVLDRLKANSLTRDIPIVVCSVDTDVQKGLAHGADEYLIKPVSRVAMRGAIRKSMQGRTGHTALLVLDSDIARPDGEFAPPTPEERSKPLVLIVDDNPENVLTVLDFLEAKGFEARIADNGLEAIRKAEAFLPDVILMDVQMPKMDGLEATQRIRRIEALKDIPIIAVTALAMPGDREKCHEAGMDDYISKPVKLVRLAASIKAQLKRVGSKLADSV